MKDSFMKMLVRRAVGRLVRWTDRHCCPTYGDVASLSKGPCERCAGFKVSGGGYTLTTGGTVGMKADQNTTGGYTITI